MQMQIIFLFAANPVGRMPKAVCRSRLSYEHPAIVCAFLYPVFPDPFEQAFMIRLPGSNGETDSGNLVVGAVEMDDTKSDGVPACGRLGQYRTIRLPHCAVSV